MSTSTYLVVTPVLSGKRYAPGSTIDLADADAAPLLDLGAIKLPPANVTVLASAPAVPTLSKPTLGKLTVAELTAYAQALGLPMAEGATKDQILESIVSAMPAPAAAAAPPAEGA
jgi:hypothetical protein